MLDIILKLLLVLGFLGLMYFNYKLYNKYKCDTGVNKMDTDYDLATHIPLIRDNKRVEVFKQMLEDDPYYQGGVVEILDYGSCEDNPETFRVVQKVNGRVECIDHTSAFKACDFYFMKIEDTFYLKLKLGYSTTPVKYYIKSMVEQLALEGLFVKQKVNLDKDTFNNLMKHPCVDVRELVGWFGIRGIKFFKDKESDKVIPLYDIKTREVTKYKLDLSFSEELYV